MTQREATPDELRLSYRAGAALYEKLKDATVEFQRDWRTELLSSQNVLALALTGAFTAAIIDVVVQLSLGDSGATRHNLSVIVRQLELAAEHGGRPPMPTGPDPRTTN